MGPEKGQPAYPAPDGGKYVKCGDTLRWEGRSWHCPTADREWAELIAETDRKRRERRWKKVESHG